MKKCFKCGIEKPLTEFYAHPQMADGHLNKCKTCNKADTKRRYQHLAENDPEWYEKELERLRKKSARKRASGIVSKTTAGKLIRYRLRHPLKATAHQIFRHAVRSGKIKKSPCEICGDVKAQAHHDDYTKPLDVRWLCVKHHAEYHREEKKRLRALGIFKSGATIKRRED